MMPLDDVSRRLFPSLAQYARRTRRLALLCSHTLLFLAGVAVALLFLGYHQHVATENQHSLIGRVALLENNCQPITITKKQAQDWAYAKQKKEQKP